MISTALQQAITQHWGGLPDEQQIVASWRGDAGLPVVSVLCHVYNQVEYVHAALAGILKQRTSFPFEVIVRDDASSDGTSELVKAYAERFPRLIRATLERENRYRQGVKPIAATFPLVRGDFIAFCEGDDCWLDGDKLQAQVDYMHKHPDCGLVHGNYMNLIHAGGAWRTRLAFRKPEQLQHRSGAIYREMLSANRVQTCTALCRSSIAAEYRRVGPGVDGYMVADWPLFLYLAHEAAVGFIDRPMAAYRRVAGSMTNSGYQSAVERAVDAIRMARDFCSFFSDDDATLQSALVEQHRTLCRLAFQAGDRARFEQALTWLQLHKPEAVGSSARAMHAAIRMAPLQKLVLSISNLVESVGQTIQFRKVDSEAAW